MGITVISMLASTVFGIIGFLVGRNCTYRQEYFDYLKVADEVRELTGDIKRESKRINNINARNRRHG